MKVIEVKNIEAVYTENAVLKNISFGVNGGEVLAIVGESGAGKSTLLNTIAGFIDANRGEVLLEETKVDGPSNKLIAGHSNIKLVAQDYKLNPNFTVRENIVYAIRNYTKEFQTERLNELLSLFRITEIAEKLPKNISGGEKQRTAIAKAIADVPKVLLLDEPFSNLDNINKRKLKLALAQLIKNKDIACVFVTHDLLDAINFANRIGFIKEGHLLEIIPSEAIKNYTGNTYIEEFIEASF